MLISDAYMQRKLEYQQKRNMALFNVSVKFNTWVLYLPLYNLFISCYKAFIWCLYTKISTEAQHGIIYSLRKMHYIGIVIISLSYIHLSNMKV